MKKKITVLLTAAALAVNTVSTGNITFAQTTSSKVETSQYAPNDKVTVIVELKDTPMLEKYEQAEIKGKLPAETSFDEYVDTKQADLIADNLEQKQDKVADKVESLKSVDHVDVLYNYTAVMNGFATEVEYKALADIRKLPDVKAAYIAGRYKSVKPLMDSSVNLTGANEIWDLNYKGEGTVVAVIDSGLDYNHESFKADPKNPKIKSPSDIKSKIDAAAGLKSEVKDESKVFKSLKVPYVYDYADHDTDVIPGMDDYGLKNHGTHVAGTVAGNGKVVGIAPEAQLMIMKVFNDSKGEMADEDTLAALDDAVTLGADVINMSIGYSNGFTIEGKLWANDVYNRINDGGITIALAAGNEYSCAEKNGLNGKAFASNPDTSTVNSPSTFEACTSVASVINAGEHSYYFSADSKKIAYSESAERNQPTFSGNLSVVSGGAINYVVVPNVGNDEDYSAINVTGKVALIKRGSISFPDKVANAESHGAIGVIIYDNIKEERIKMGIDPDDYKIPAVFITQDDGNILVNAKHKVLQVAVEKETFENVKANQLSDFSSWGVTPDLKLKPEIAAPGENIYSTLPENKYGSISGTSMAAPHIAGCFALVKEYLNGKSDKLSNVKKARLANQLLMSTAMPSKNPDNIYYSPRKQGSGVVNVLRAVTTSGYLYTDEAVEPKQRPKLNLGDDVNKTGTFTKKFHITNVTGAAITYDLSSVTLTETAADGMVAETPKDISSNTSVKFTVKGENVNSVTLQPKEDVVVDVIIQLEQAAKKYIDDNFKNGEFVDGYVFLKSKNTCDLSIPFMGFYGDWTQAPLFDSGSANDLKGYQQTYHCLLSEAVVSDEKNVRLLGVNPFDYKIYELISNDYNPFIYGEMYEKYLSKADNGKIAISPNSDGNFDRFEFALLSLLRNAKELNWSITSDADEVIKSGVMNYETKSIYDVNKEYMQPTVITDIAFEGKDANGKAIANNKTVTFRVKGTLDYSAHAQKNTRDTLSFPITIDVEKPSYIGLSNCEDGFHISVTDNQYVSAVELYNKSDLSKPVDKILVDEDKKGATTVYNVDLKKLSLTGKPASDFQVKIYDYAMNSATYNLVADSPNVGVPSTPSIPVISPNVGVPSTPSMPVVSPVPTQEPGHEKKTFINDVKISPAQISLFVHGTDRINVTLPTLTKDDVTSTTFSTSNEEVAAVSDSGEIRAKKSGVATITTTVKINSESKTFKTKVTVKKPYIYFHKEIKTLKVGKSFTFTVKAYGVTGKPKFYVSDNKVASINVKTGKLEAKKPGKVVISVKIGKVSKKTTVVIK